MRKTTIVVPCYNESERLDTRAFAGFVADHEGVDFLFVNDGSTDATMEKLEKLHRADPERLKYLDLEENSGKAEAVRRGVAKALEDGCDNVGYWDADLATGLEEIPPFAEIIDTTETNIVLASRVKLLGREIERKAMRHYLGRVFATCASLILRLPVYDTQCGAKLFRRTPILEEVFSKPFRVRWTFDVELLARYMALEKERGVKRPESKWVEYPVHRWVDVQGSKLGYADFLSGGLDLVKLFAYLHLPIARGLYMRYLRR